VQRNEQCPLWAKSEHTHIGSFGTRLEEHANEISLADRLTKYAKSTEGNEDQKHD
jgi:hypothetical protein